MVSNKSKTGSIHSGDFVHVLNSVYPELDPVAMPIINAQSGQWNSFWANSGNYVTQSQTGNWNTAYSRGNHALAGYLTGIGSQISGLNTSVAIISG